MLIINKKVGISMFTCELIKEKIEHLKAKFMVDDIPRALILGNSNLQYILGIEASGFFYMDLETNHHSVYVAPIDYSKVLDIIEDCGLRFELIVYGKLTEITSVIATRVYPVDYNSLLKQIFSQDKITGINIDALPLELRDIIAKGNNGTTKDISTLLAQAKAMKTEKEKQAIMNASEITEKAIIQTISEIDEKTTIRIFKSRLIQNLYMNGADSLAFEPIIAVDKDASYPHPPDSNSVSQKKIHGHSLLLIDVGGKAYGYSSDMTRIILLSSSNRLNELAEFLEQSYWIAIEKISEGTLCRDVDLEARRFLSRLGLEKYFIHSLGHGVGINVHEPPYISPFSKDVFNNNNVFTIEPGIYFRNNIGLRVENTLVLEKNKVKSYMKSSLIMK